MLDRLAIAGLLAASAIGAGCPTPGSQTTVPAEGSGPDDAEPAPEDLTARMTQHFTEVSAIKDAVIEGDLPTVHETAAALRERETETTRPVDWRPFVSDLLTATEGLEGAEDIDAAAKRTAYLGSRCGACHQSVGARPVFDHELPPEEADDAAARMRRHQWGVDRMWEGLVGPSKQAWAWGAETIAETPGCAGESSNDAYLDTLCERLDALGRSALDARDLDDRTLIYGEFLGTCAQCHGRIDAAASLSER